MYEIYAKIRDSKGLKDYNVAKGTGISTGTFGDWKAGNYNPKIDKLQKIAEFLGVSVNVFFESEEAAEAEAVKFRIMDAHKAMASGDPDLYLFEKYRKDREFMDYIRLLFYLPPDKRDYVYQSIKLQTDSMGLEKEKDGGNSDSLKVG